MSVDANHERASMRDDGHGDRASFLNGHRTGRYRPAPVWEEVTSWQLCDEPRPGRVGQPSDQVTEVGQDDAGHTPTLDKSIIGHPVGAKVVSSHSGARRPTPTLPADPRSATTRLTKWSVLSGLLT